MRHIDRRRLLAFGLGAALAPITLKPTWAASTKRIQLNLRKRFGGGSGGSGGSGGTTTPPPAPVVTGLLRAVVTVGGASYEVREDQGRNLGEFVSEIGGFTQRCIAADVAGLPMTVFFRPDLNSSRVEVVFELGRLFSGTAANLGAYRVAIYRGTEMLASVDVPAHYWFSRWRWQSAPRPIVANVDTLMSQGLLPPYSRAADSLTGTAQTYSVMGLAGVTAYMPMTGERNDIGLLTEPQAHFLRTSNQNALTTLRAQAEAAGTVPWHLRDENTGAPIDFRTYPKANWYSASAGSPYIAGVYTPISIDSAHQPALAYMPYLLTGDPYHLEDLQFQATWNWGALPPGYRPSIPQSRAFAWSLRTLAQCARMTPATTPAWLLPRTYWLDQLSVHRTFFETEYVEGVDPLRSVFRSSSNMWSNRDEGPTAPGGSWTDPWQDEFLASVFGWIVSMGFADWRPSFDWLIGGTIARTNGSSGWVRAQAVPYRMILRASNTSPVASSWSEAWQLTRDINGAPVDDANTWQPADMTYLTYAQGALVFAVRLGTPGARDCLTWASGQLTARGWNTAHKWRLLPGG